MMPLAARRRGGRDRAAVPKTRARLISASLQPPIPVSTSPVMFGAVATKAGVVNVKSLVGDRPAVGIARRMVIAAGHDGADEIETALHRRFRRGGTRGCEQQHSNDDTDPNHPVPPRWKAPHASQRWPDHGPTPIQGNDQASLQGLG